MNKLTEKWRAHPAAEAFPLLEGEDFEALVADIKANGLREPITLHPDGSILDGRNRYRACAEAGVEPCFQTWDGQGTPGTFVTSMNLARRHLTTRQRAAIGAELATMESGTRTDLSPNGDRSVSQAEAAKNVGVSKRSVERATKVMKEDPEAHEAAKRGDKKTSGGRITVPDGKTPEIMCREGMAAEEAGLSSEEAAKEIGVAVAIFRKMKDIILLADRPDLSDSERCCVVDVLADMNAWRQVGPNHVKVSSIADSVWGTGEKGGATRAQIEARRLAVFDRASGAIVDACMLADTIEIPRLGGEETTKVCVELTGAKREIGKLIAKLKEMRT